MENQNEYIHKLVASGLSVLPVTEGEKRPHQILGPKHDLLTRLATQEEVDSWITGGVKSWGVTGGAVSGNLVTLDFDEKHYPGLYELWYAKLSDEQRKIVDTCHKNSTRNKGTHIHYRTQSSQPTTKLASRVELNTTTNKEEIVTTAETRGEGSYALIPPSAGYATTQGSLLDLPLVLDEIHEELIDLLRVFNEVEDEPATEYEWKPSDFATGDRPGDRFNQQATWNEILEPHEWVEESKNYWRRPGKERGQGISATTNYDDRPMIYVFSSSASPFEQNKGYSKFHAFTLLNHGGDFKEAAREAADRYPTSDGSRESVIEKCDQFLSKVPKDTPMVSMVKVLTPMLELLASSLYPEEAEIYIRNKVKKGLDLKSHDINSILKGFKRVSVQVFAKAGEVRRKAEIIVTDPPLTNEEKQAAEQTLKSPTLLYDVLKMIKRLGVVGEEKNVLLHYAILTSRMLKQPLSATVKGDSSSGKSYTLLTTIRLFPKSAYIDLTDATPQSFYYCPKDHFKHKMIVIFEKHGGEKADYAIRTLQSEGKLKIQVTVQNPETGDFEAKIIEKEGPTGFITTTTASMIHVENDTRNISMFPDQSSEQTGRVYESVDSRYLGAQSISDDELKPWHHAQLELEQLPVFIPFVKSFRNYFPKHIVRTRRDYGHFLAIVETVAFLHQKQRERVEIHGRKYIRATLADAYIASIIVENALSKSIYELPEKTIEVIEVAKLLIEELGDQGDDKEATFTITKLARKLGWDRDTVAKWMEPATKKGYATVVVDARGSKGAEYKVEDKDLPGSTFLPSVDDLLADNPGESVDNIYNPITGESVHPELESARNSTDVPMDSRGDVVIVPAEIKAPTKPVGTVVQNSPWGAF